MNPSLKYKVSSLKFAERTELSLRSALVFNLRLENSDFRLNGCGLPGEV